MPKSTEKLADRRWSPNFRNSNLSSNLDLAT
jgi:hypothetical protein